MERIYEAALHALITQRCQRAYVHDMRNGLQRIYGGFELLSRAVSAAATGAKIPPEKAIDFSKQAIKNHEQALDRILSQLILSDETQVPTHVGEVLGEISRFLNNDASARDIALSVAVAEDAAILVRPGRLRLVFLALLVDAIDSLPPHSELRVQLSKQKPHVRIEITSSKMVAGKWDTSASEAVQIDLQAEPLRKGLIVPAAKKLIEAEGGTLHFSAGQTLMHFTEETSES